MMKRIITALRKPALVAGFLLSAAIALAQTYPGQFPANTVYGNATGATATPTPGQVTGSQIGSATVTGSNIASGTVANSNLANMAAAGVKGATAAGPVADMTSTQTLSILKTAPWPDTSEVIGSGAAKWNPLFFTNPGTGIVHRFNRILCGEATASSSDIGPVTTKDWLETLIPNTTGVAEFVCVDTVGQLGVVGASRTSDFRTFNGSASLGSQGVSGYAYNNDTGSGNPIAAGMLGQALHAASVTGVSEAIEMNIGSNATVVDVTPFGGVVGGNTFASNTSAGFAGFTNNVSAAHVIGQSVAPAQFRKGIVCLNGALDTTVGAGTNGVCHEMARNQSVRWLNSTPTTDGEIWANATGLHANPGFPSQIPLSIGNQAAVPQATTRFFVSAQDNGNGEATVIGICPRAGTFRNAFMQVLAVGGTAQTATFTWRVASSNTAITCTINTGSTTCNDTTHTASCTAGQVYSMQIVASATTGNIQGGGGIEFDAQ